MIAENNRLSGKNLDRQYREHISDYYTWDQKGHASDWVLFKKNLGSYVSMDETTLSQGELYTILTNKSAKGKKGSLIAMVKGTKSEMILDALLRMPRNKRLQVREITVDLSPTMHLIARRAFPKAKIVSDRFHVQKLMNEALNDLRVSFRWEAIDDENEQILYCKENNRKFVPHILRNGDTIRKLLSRSRYILLKNRSKWTKSQAERAEILFERYPLLEQAYKISQELTAIFNTKCESAVAMTKLAKWYDKVEILDCKYFNSVIKTMQNNYRTICNYFDNRSTNASAESFNAKIKAFRSQFRGVRDIPFFIFRLKNLFA